MTKDNIKKLLFLILIVLSLLLLCVTIDYAGNVTSNVTISNVNETRDSGMIIDNDTYYMNGSYYAGFDPKPHITVGKLVVEKDDPPREQHPLITITSKPSCGSCGYSYTWHKKTFVNYCPYCHKYGVLTNLHKSPARFEQEISCSRCGSDWCGCCGKEKYSWSHKYLIPA